MAAPATKAPTQIQQRAPGVGRGRGRGGPSGPSARPGLPGARPGAGPGRGQLRPGMPGVPRKADPPQQQESIEPRVAQEPDTSIETSKVVLEFDESSILDKTADQSQAQNASKPPG